jgi:hypothetical protein
MNRKSLFTLLSTFTMIIGFAGSASAATFCQDNGHGAYGCDLGGGTLGYCVRNSQIGTTGYVCTEKDPNKKEESRVVNDKGDTTSGGSTNQVKQAK